MLAKPVMGGIGDRYGWRTLPDGTRNFHNGVDFTWLNADPAGSQRVVAPADGVVSVGWNSLIGNFVSLAVDANHVVRLCHFSSIAVQSGQRVRKGQFLGVMGNTGSQAFGVHLHMDMYVNAIRVDPLPYMTDPYPGELAFAGLETTPIVKEDDMTKPQIIAPHGLDARAVVGGGLAYVFPSAGELAHFRNFTRPTNPDIDETVTVGDAGMTPADRMAVFNTIVRIHQSAQGIANQVAALPGQVDKALADDFAATRVVLSAAEGTEVNLSEVTAALKALPAEVVAAIKAAL